MDRRNFFKIVSTVSAGVATTACSSNKSDALTPLLVPEHEIIPGEEQWHPSVCSECSAGCGVIVRIMEGERIIERSGQKFRERVACVKKIEGNPLDPVSGGRLCARGHAALQSLYNPDRVRGPMRRSSERGKAEFHSISWSEAIATVADKLAQAHSSDPAGILFLTTPQAGTRTLTIQHFLASIGAPPPLTSSIAAFASERKAADMAFGWKGLPRYDLAHARYALGVGADFVSGWVSPVYYARQFGQFRQGRPGIRGKLVHADSRMSLTAASADEWLPLRPGAEPHFLIAITRLLLDEKLVRNASQLPAAVNDSIARANLPDLIRATGIDEARIRRVARELGESEAPIVIAGASVLHTNSVQALLAAHYLNLLLGNIGQTGGVLPPYPRPVSFPESASPQNPNIAETLKRAQLLMLDGDNPLYSLPKGSGIAQALTNIRTIVSFGSFIDDTAAYADAILPDHHALESESALIPAVANSSVAINIGVPFIRPLYDTRAIDQTLGELAQKINAPFETVSARNLVTPLLETGETWDQIARQGGLWRENGAATPGSKPLFEKLEWGDAAFDGTPDQFPFIFQPYPSLQYQDGRGANLPWMQELPDPTSSSMWGVPVEVDAQTAVRLNIATGDWVRLESAHGALEAPAYVHPAALPGVVSMAIGEGHAHYGRYASGKGANPLSILAPVWDHSTGALASGATRVRLARLEKKPEELIQFSPSDREQGRWGYR